MTLPTDKIVVDASKSSIKKDIIVYKGTTFEVSFQLFDENEEPLDVTEYTANSKFREYYTSSNSSAFTCSIAANGIVTLELTANATANLKAPCRYVYDVFLTHTDNTIIRIIDGYLWAVPSVT